MRKEIKIANFDPRMRHYVKQLKTQTVYGPITSRRLGLSLGINPVQGGFVCNFNCSYCQYGWTGMKKIGKGARFSSLSEIKSALEKRLKTKEKFNNISICGPTEPTLHPNFNKIVNLVIKLRNKYRPKVPVGLFTNASKDLRRLNLSSLDFVFLKLDAGNERTFKKVNRPWIKIKLKDIIKNIEKAKLKKKIIQTMLVKGKDGNYNKSNLEDYIKILKKIKPEEVHLYSLLYRPPFDVDVKYVSKKEMCELARKIKERVKCKVYTFVNPVEKGKKFRY